MWERVILEKFICYVINSNINYILVQNHSKMIGKKTNKPSKYVKGQLNSLNFKKDNQDYRH